MVRVSENKERKMPAHGLVYEMDFRFKGTDFSGSGDTFTIYLGDALDETIKNNIPGVSFGYEANGRVYIHLDDTSKEIGRFTSFNDKWHNIRIFMDNVYDRISIILDGKLVFEDIPRDVMAYFSPALSIAVGAGNDKHIEIDDVSVSAFYAHEENIKGNPSSYPGPYALGSRPHFTFTTLFNEDFGRLKEKNSIESSGWKMKGKLDVERDQEESELKALSIKAGENEQVTVVKTFNIPVDFPFDISDKNFEIRYNDSMYSDSAAYDIYTGHGGSGISAGNFLSSSAAALSNSTPGISRTSELFNTYYIYTFDGKLLAEYDHNGICVRDYIYAGNRLIAEYKPQTVEYFYYMTDQINSTRIITNGSGNVVFSEAAGPYGDVQKNWINTYDPKMKFSGKEREGYSDLDYFGARYYDHKSYRFNSVDPVINKLEALYNPQSWNLYAYCNNNPITFFDPDGLRVINKSKRVIPIVINSINPDGTQGKQRIEYLQPGDDTDKLFPGQDTDGIYPPDTSDKRVLKIVNEAEAIVREDGKVEVTAPFPKNILQKILGGIKDENWIKDKKWPTPWDNNVKEDNTTKTKNQNTQNPKINSKNKEKDD